MTSSTASASFLLSLGVDGLPHVNDTVLLRLREVDMQYKLKLSVLQSQLDRARQEVHAHAQQMKLEVGGERGGADEEGAGSQKEEAVTPEEQVRNHWWSFDQVFYKSQGRSRQLHVSLCKMRYKYNKYQYILYLHFMFICVPQVHRLIG